MIVRNLNEILGSERDVHAETWNSRRLLLADDKMGFSLHDTIIKAGTSTEMQYLNHLEAVYCVRGKGEVTCLKTKNRYPIEDGTVYALDKHDHHLLTASSELRLICVFNPPVTGKEVHDENGAYPLCVNE